MRWRLDAESRKTSCISLCRLDIRHALLCLKTEIHRLCQKISASIWKRQWLCRISIYEWLSTSISKQKKTWLHIQNNLGPLHMLLFILICSPQNHVLFGFPCLSSTHRRPLRLRLGLAWVMEADLCKDWKVAQNLCFTGWLDTVLIKLYHIVIVWIWNHAVCMYCKGMEWYVVIHAVVCYVP